MANPKGQNRQIFRTAAAGFLIMTVIMSSLLFLIRDVRQRSNEEQPVPEYAEAADSTAEAAESEAQSSAEAADSTEAAASSIETVHDTTKDDSFYVDTSMGRMLYYNQTNERWANYLWGGEDELSVYGCGPTAMAMAANAFGNKGTMTPATMADWCDVAGVRVPKEGSLHSIVMTTLPQFGLTVESAADKMNVEYLTGMLKEGHIFIALVGRGYFTDNGHFIIIRGVNDDGTVNIADPANADHTRMSYTPEFILGELKLSASDAGGPLWCVSKQ